MIASLVSPHLRPMLSKGVALGLAALLAACGGHSNTPPVRVSLPTPPVSDPAPAPPVNDPAPTPPVSDPAPAPPATQAVTYDVIPLNPRGESYGYVSRRGINAVGMVAGTNVYPEPVGRRAFLYDGTRLIELGTFGGAYSSASAINRCGQVTGWAETETASEIHHAFLYDGTLHDLGTFGGPSSEGNAINNCGTIAGFAAAPAYETHGFVYDGSMRDIGTLPGGTTSSAVDINSRGIVAGYGNVAGGATHAFIYDSKAGTSLQDLGTLGGISSVARVINDAGQVAGESDTAAGARHAFRYSGGVMQDLGTFDGTGTSNAIDMNAAGQVIGLSFSVDDPRRGFFYDGTTMHDLGLNTVPTAINASGQVVGSYAAPGLSAMSWTAEEGIVDLNTRLHAPPAGMHVLNALAISDNGSIVALSNTGLVLLKVRH